MQLNGGRIELQLNVVQLLTQNLSAYTEAQVKAFQILSSKAQLGHKNVDSLIKSKIINSEQIIVNIIIGKSAIIDQDINHQLQNTISVYKIHYC